MTTRSEAGLEGLSQYRKPITLIAIALLLLAILPWPYGFYIFLKWVVTLSSIFLAYLAHNLKKTFWVILFTLTAVLFNPIVRVPFDREIWQALDIVVAILFLVSIFKINERKN